MAHFDEFARIIPADAGSTIIGGHRLVGVEDHPRGCGEHFLGFFDHVRQAGSSPRMRGARQRGASVA